MQRVTFHLDAREYESLVCLCERDLRGVPDEVRHLLRVVLKRRGYLRRGSDEREATSLIEPSREAVA